MTRGASLGFGPFLQVDVGLWDADREPQLEVLTAQWVFSVVTDQRVDVGEVQVWSQVEVRTPPV